MHSDRIVDPEKFLSYEGVVDILHLYGFVDLDKDWVRSQADRKNIPYTVVAKKRRFLKSEIISFLENIVSEAKRKEWKKKRL